MLKDTKDRAQVREETVRLACRLARNSGQRRIPPKVFVRYTDRTHASGVCKGRHSITLRLPRGASVPQALALICHEVAHWLAPRDEKHGDIWRMWFAKCANAYEAGVDGELKAGTKNDVHDRVRKALAARLNLPQANAVDLPTVDVAVVTQPIDDAKRTKVCRQVAQALILAAKAGNEHEATVAALTASRLLRAYRLTMEDVTESHRNEEDPLVSRFLCQGVSRRVGWRAKLGFGVATALGCYSLSTYRRLCPSCKERGVQANHTQMQYFGRKSAVDIAAYVYIYLLREIDRLARIGVKSRKIGEADNGGRSTSSRAWGSAFRSGCVYSALVKLNETAKKDAKDAAAREADACDERAVALLRTDYADAEEYAYAKIGHTIGRGRSYSGGRGSAAGRDAGLAAGATIQVSRAVGGGGGGGGAKRIGG